MLGEAAGAEEFEGLWSRSIPMEVKGVPVHVASISDLISMKRAANRPKDQAHALELIELQKLLEAQSAPESP